MLAKLDCILSCSLSRTDTDNGSVIGFVLEVQAGYIHEAAKLLRDAVAAGLPAQVMAYVCVIENCAHQGEAALAAQVSSFCCTFARRLMIPPADACSVRLWCLVRVCRCMFPTLHVRRRYGACDCIVACL